jgi:hypothetical protein
MDSLQFQKAGFSNPPACSACKSAIYGPYYHLAGQRICAPCAELARIGQQRPANAAVLRGTIFGAGMAAVCSAGYAAIVMVSGMELALVAIAVGFMVGRAVRRGSDGLGGRRCQTAAAVLTYLAITMSYIPLMARDTAVSNVTPAAYMAVALFYPLLALTDGIRGILGIVIIAFGLMQAWKQTARDPRVITGPYTLEEGTSPVA